MGLQIFHNERLGWRRQLPVAESARTTCAGELSAMIVRLREENATLRSEVERLRGYESLAYRDHLTNLRNRRAFAERIDEECARVSRGPDYAFSLILVDLDDFKSVNDTYGHAAGDAVLRTVSLLLEANVRNVDLVYRLGGDEFAILLPATPEEGAHDVVQRLEARLTVAVATLPTPVGISFGVAGAPPHDGEADAVIAAADQAMYRAKRRRKGLLAG